MKTDLKANLFLRPGQRRHRAHPVAGLGMAAATLAVMALASFPASASQQVGVQAAVRGDVQLIAPETLAARAGRGGDSVFFLETVTSKANSGLQILLLDETTFTVGPNSEIVIDEMVYDPGADSKLVVSIAKGAFRYISGEIAKNNPENVTIRTPNGDIGIRGTSFLAMADPETGSWYIGLLGPGPRNNTGDKPGGIVFRSAGGSTEVRRSGYGFTVSPDGALSAVEPIPMNVMVAFQNTISGGQPPVGEAAPPITAGAAPATGGTFANTAETSGENTAITRETVNVQAVSESLQGMLSAETAMAAASVGTTASLMPLTYSNLGGYSGTVSYAVTGANLYSGSLPNVSGVPKGSEIRTFLNSLSGTSYGTYDFGMSIDFGTKEFKNGQFTNINVTSLNITNGSTGTFTINYAASAGSVDENYHEASIDATAYAIDAYFTLLPGTSVAPNFLGAVAIEENATGNDVLIGGGIIKP